ncbi:MAG TPA: lipoate--protein ligase family protein [Anaerolineae bacterium]|nr:lipoate--protein ligase family protein [Anaerolineae bacterium]
MTSNEWRLIIHTPAEGAWNMAVDEAILESVCNYVQKPTLRLYAWNPYCVSLGHAQPISDIDLTSLKNHGWQLVRRPTGGRAILHADELTYSVCAPLEEPLVSGSVLESYRRLSTALLKALQLLGIHAISKPKYNHQFKSKKNPVCFEVPSDYEITCNGKKIIGSAQARKKYGVLQHGAIPIYGDLTRIIEVLAFSNKNNKNRSEERLKVHAGTLEYYLKRRIPWKDVSQAVIEGFKLALEIKLIPGQLSYDEQQRANILIIEKYGNDTWTKRI